MAKASLITNYQSLITKIKTWIVSNKLEFIILVLILSIGAFMRLYRIDGYMTFLGDEGRDVIVVRRLLVDFDPILVGPGTSIGNMYLGPLYYYMMAPALLLASFSPVGPAVMIALLGVATIFLVWYIAREWFGRIAAIVASLLYAITPIVIIYSRSSWNPNIMPFFALLTIYSIWQVWKKQKYRWLIVTSVSFAFVLQSHYLGLLLGPVVGLFWFITYLQLRIKKIGNWKLENGKFLRHTLLAGVIFAGLMSPLVIFDARHGWRNFQSMKTFFTQRQTTVSARPWTAFPKLWPLIEKITTRLVAGKSEFMGGISSKVLSLLTLATIVVLIIKIKSKKYKLTTRRLSAFFLIAVWLGVALIGLGVYKQEIYDHYYGFFFAAPFLLIGGIVQELLQDRKKVDFLRFFLLSIVVYALIHVNLANNPLKYSPNRQLQRTKEVARAVIEYSNGEPFNFAVIAERNYEGAYMYFLEMWKAPAMIAIADILDETLAEQMFVVCEVQGERCNPETNERPELTNFGWRKVVASWDVAGVTIHKVIHTQ